MASYNPFDDDTLFPTAPVKATTWADAEPFAPAPKKTSLPACSAPSVIGYERPKSEIHYLMTALWVKFKTPYWLLLQTAYFSNPEAFKLTHSGHVSGPDVEPHITMEHTIRKPWFNTAGYPTGKESVVRIRYHIYYTEENGKRYQTHITDGRVTIAEFGGTFKE
jgi:hypothetical protein